MSAIFSQCGVYRYRLDRKIDMLGGPTIGFCLHNPSSADARQDDPTLRRGIAFAKFWGASRLIFINPWAAVATKPYDLWTKSDPIGPDNDLVIAGAAVEIAESAGFVVVAWGAIKPPATLRSAAYLRLAHVARIIHGHGCDLKTLGRNQDGSPKHPLYVKKLTIPVPWRSDA